MNTALYNKAVGLHEAAVKSRDKALKGLWAAERRLELADMQVAEALEVLAKSYSHGEKADGES